MAINKLLPDGNLNEEEGIAVQDNTDVSTPTDADIAAIVSMPIDEVDALLLSMGLDPNAPLPERLAKFTLKKENPSSGECRLRVVKGTSARPRLSWVNPLVQAGRLTLSLSRPYVAALLCGVISVAMYSLLRQEADLSGIRAEASEATRIEGPSPNKGNPGPKANPPGAFSNNRKPTDKRPSSPEGAPKKKGEEKTGLGRENQIRNPEMEKRDGEVRDPIAG